MIDADKIIYEPQLSPKGNGMYEEVMVAYKHQIDDVATETQICGYNIEQLIAFAEVCRSAGVDDSDLKAFANNIEFSFEYAWSSVQEMIEQTIAQFIDGQKEDE